MKKDISSAKVFKLLSTIKFKAQYFEQGNEKEILKASTELDSMMIDLLTGYQMYIEMQKSRDIVSGDNSAITITPVRVPQIKTLKKHE